jgi:hypothetical protein
VTILETDRHNLNSAALLSLLPLWSWHCSEKRMNIRTEGSLEETAHPCLPSRYQGNNVLSE